MNILELREILKNEKVNPLYVSFDARDRMMLETTICIRRQTDGKLLYYVQDRANREDVSLLDSEHDICMKVLKELKYSYPGTQKYL